jgi:hypothetical protein
LFSLCLSGSASDNLYFAGSYNILVKEAIILVEIAYIGLRMIKMIMEKATQPIFDSFENTDIAVALISKDGDCIANRPEVFDKIFSNQELLESLCRRIDDGQEPLMTCLDDSLVVASGLSTGDDDISYAVMIVPDCSPERAIGCMDFVEIILSQISQLASKGQRDMEASSFLNIPYDPQLLTEAALN